ncbi:SUKH-4 family immunity protein [Streptomyces sp. H10-C2]|uniref:SUKH-4 family immunity protein n=1 Tax=unclassified Streptomyces TaxID=2593676 RepID=UPI0024B9C9B7|nr:MULTISPECIES: SUKH-4 family immunity protein [unclassified Streptomyces]MDJ0341335.1 SUKH-4 family immunity protein [Streptomyces sp. PH10-H1]MDJ0370930.1 SUKH-4 family immunity protein [Streptomyces sp. H10-C2]
MVTFAQAQERAERWINGDVPAYQAREVRVREFDLGFVAWSEPREDGPSSDDGQVRLVIARDSGEATLWPGLPVGEVIRRYEEEYGAVPNDAAPPPPQRIDLEATSFLISPPQWLQDAADKMGIPDRRPAAAASASVSASQASPASPAAPAVAASASPSAGASPGASSAAWSARTTSSDDSVSVPVPATVFAPPISDSDDAHTPPPIGADAKTELMPQGSSLPATMIAPPDGAGGAGFPIAPATPGAGGPGNPGGPAGSGYAGPGLPPPAGPGAALPPPAGLAAPGAPGRPGGPGPGGPGGPGAPGRGAADIADADTAKAVRGGVPSAGPVRRSPDAPPPPSAPGVPGASNAPRSPGAPGAPGTPPPGGVNYAATMLAGPAVGGPGMPPPPPGVIGGGSGGPPPPPPPGVPGGHGAPPPPPAAGGAGGPGGVNYAATMLAGPAVGGPGMPPPPPGVIGGGSGGPPPPPPPGVPGGHGAPPPPGAGGPGGAGGVNYAATMLAGPGVGGPGGSGGPGMPPPPPPPPGAVGQPPPSGGYGYPQPPAGVPTVGPGYMAVLSYRAHDGSQQQLIRRSAPGTPHPEWQILHELRALNVPPQQVLELHTELEACDLPGGYCARMIRETWPQVRISHTAPYGREHASRQQGVQHLLTHQGELHQVASAPARPQPQRVPMPDPNQVQRVPPIPLEGIGHELAQAFGPQGLFRFDQRAVSRQGVPDIVAQTLMWAGLPVDFGPFFWAQAQPGRPVPTLAELAQERGVQPASDAGSYLVMGNDFGRQLCVQYGTAHIVAVPLEAGPGGQPVPPQFVNSSLPEFARCLALLGRMWRLRIGLTPDQAGRWTVDFQAQLAAQDPAAIASPDNWWAVLIEQMWDGLL